MKTIIVSTLWGYCSNESSYRRWLEQYLAHTVFNKYQLLWEPLSFLRPPGEGPRQYDAVVPAAAGGLRTVRAGLWGTDQQQRQSGKKECKLGILWADSAPNGLASQRNVATASHSLILMASTHHLHATVLFLAGQKDKDGPPEGCHHPSEPDLHHCRSVGGVKNMAPRSILLFFKTPNLLICNVPINSMLEQMLYAFYFTLLCFLFNVYKIIIMYSST